MSGDSKSTEYDPECLTYLLPSYYGRVFPTKLMYRWLSYGNPDFFARREFSFALAGDIYIRYQSFNNDEDFLAELKKKKPEKIDIGAVYNQRPRSRDTLKDFIPLEKEFVLDIDLTDYDDVRTCCQGAKVCHKCWKFIALAVNLLDQTLHEDFGFKNRLWVFSGRRGVHCWVCDEAAIKMDSHSRGAILEYLTVIRGGENQAKKVTIANPDRLHPFITRALTLIDKVFEEICRDDQSMLEEGDKNFEMLAPMVKAATAKSPDRFNAVMNYLEDKENKKKLTIKKLIPELKLQLCFPRLDVNVSKDLNHLLKSPFCVHPKTGQVCVPFEANKASEFQPTEVPTIITLLNEIGELDKSRKTQESLGTDKKTGMESLGVEDYKKTSLAPYMKVFEDFVKNLEKQKKKSDEKAKKSPLDF